MSWNNPTQNEAEDEYSRNKSRYQKAADERNARTKEKNRCLSEKSSCENKLKALNKRKYSFERRRDQLDEIIRVFEDGARPKSILSLITDSNRKLKRASDSKDESIRYSILKNITLEHAFKSRELHEDPHLSSALSSYKREKAKTEQLIADIDKQARQLEEALRDLNRKIASLNEIQRQLKKTMDSCTYNMLHYKKYLNDYWA